MPSYRRPASLAEASAFLAEDPDAVFLAGGQTLLVQIERRQRHPSALVDIRGLPALRGIALEGASLRIGAGTTHAEMAADPVLRRALPGLAALAGGVGDPAVRHLGTLGGSLAAADPAGCYPPAAVALAAVVLTDRREIEAEAFFVAPGATALAQGEIVTGLRVPETARAGYVKLHNPASRNALTGVFVAEGPGGVRVAVTGAAEAGVMRHGEMEAALAERFHPDAVADVPTDPAGLRDDLHGSAAYRAHLVGVMARRAVALACRLEGAV